MYLSLAGFSEHFLHVNCRGSWSYRIDSRSFLILFFPNRKCGSEPSSILLVRNRRQPPSDSLVKPPEVPASFCQHEPNDNHLTRLSTLATMLSHSLIVSAIFAAIVVAGTVPGSPVACPDAKRDAILRGDLNPEACCSYGVCKNTVVVRMS
ncbi:hypothetical protein M0657_006416 [Pyricularia oryzae]|nr:hypothetical protein M0657_006416 [Pyricularia oryzae]